MAKSLTPVQARLLQAAEAQDVPSIGYLHAVLCQLSLPRRHTVAQEIEHTSGNASLLITAGKLWDGRSWQPQPLPSGTRARLALMHISSRAVMTRQHTVDVGHSMREFLGRVGVDTNGREHATFQRQMRALAACQMRIGIGATTLVDAQPISKFTAWHSGPAEQGSLWPGTVTLTNEFYDSLVAHAVPLDMHAVAVLRHSTLALDTYAWLGHRLCRITKPLGIQVSWDSLRRQFGPERDTKSFKRELKVALFAVMTVYRGARLEQIRGGLRLLPSPPPVPRRIVAGAVIPYG